LFRWGACVVVGSKKVRTELFRKGYLHFIDGEPILSP